MLLPKNRVPLEGTRQRRVSSLLLQPRLAPSHTGDWRVESGEWIINVLACGEESPIDLCSGEENYKVLDFVREQKLAAAIKVIGCLSGAGFTLSGAMLLAGILKGSRCLVCSSIIVCGLSTLAIHWMIIPLALYIIFSIAAYTYLKTEMDADREHYEDLDPRV
ncbi:uncharacterized protein LOC108153537 isoform X1 [Drosophila miranda]|uniref:uncharacterized protein LOC108153537 isoform X1 n=1 Tax=Drosophila miranda TaxID=7229 RepID=UPI00143F0B4A|nr:uncharacterized protein LOC108153537 isoform X1 [Drosophila miranda]XP_033243594.1 uncharacterized protein LOC108153537 isoform X1 [Drosophila miranda]